MNNKPRLGCLMLKLDIPDWEDKFISLISEKDVESDDCKLEMSPHVTLCYGFPNNIGLDDIEKFLHKHITRPLKIKFNGVSLFENDDVDVIKFDIIAPYLSMLNKIAMEEFNCDNVYEYHPHMTIAKVLPGAGSKYLKEFDNHNTIKSKEIIYSDCDRNKTIWSISDNLGKLPSFDQYNKVVISKQ